MTFPSGLKRICDVCFYLTFASLIGSGDLIFTLPFFAGTAFLSAFLAPYRWIKYLSIPLLFLMFLVIQPTIQNVAILIPIIIYLVWSMPKVGERIAQFNYIPVFRLFIKAFSVILVIFVLVSLWFNTSEFTFPMDSLLFGFTFLSTSVLILRMIRHDDAVLKQTKFKMINGLPLVGIFIGTVLLSRSFFLDFILSILNLIWWLFLLPIFLIIMWVVINFISFIFDFFNIGHQDPVEMELPAFLEFIGDFFDQERDINTTMFAVIAIMLGLVMIRLIFKFLSEKSGSPIIRDDGTEEESFALNEPFNKKRRHFRNYRENQARAVYRHFLKFAQKNEINLPLHLTSDEIAIEMMKRFKSEKSNEFRDAYVQVRYGNIPCTKADIKQIKLLYKSVKEEIEQFP